MKGDFTRDTFHPGNHFKSVRLQQGRVALDADWNEECDITGHRIETETSDVVGLCGAPRRQGGFRILPTSDGQEVIVTPGRIYVDGILCELESASEVPVSLAFPASNLVGYPAGALGGVDLEAGDWVEIVHDLLSPDVTGTIAQVVGIDDANLQIELDQEVGSDRGQPNTRLRRWTTYATQPDDSEPPPLPEGEGDYLFYLDVWERHVTALEAPEIRETALGGPDTATRVRTVCQVKWIESEPSLGCSSDPGTPRSGRLRARTQPQPDPDDPCIVPAGAGFKRLENQLYRVEIHGAGELGNGADEPTFKWSRENAHVVTAWLAQGGASGERLTVRSAGRDMALGFAPGHWVEVTDDLRELHGEAGALVRVSQVEGDVLVIDPQTASETIRLEDFGTNPKIRRWDMADGAITATGGGWITLEGGIEVRFEAGSYRTGDYWWIPARTSIGGEAGDIEWPRDELGEPLPQAPKGIAHHYCPLAVLHLGRNGWTPLQDCRKTFPAITEMLRFFKVGGDGQHGLPGEVLPCQLGVAVTNGQWPVVGARVRFTLISSAYGELRTATGGAGSDSVTSETGSAGLAVCFWSLPAVVPRQADGQRRCLLVRASLLDDLGLDRQAPPALYFSADVNVAGDVAYDPSDCRPLQETQTVQEALDSFCGNYALYYAGGDGQSVIPGEFLPQPLCVLVTLGRWVQPGADVLFSVTSGAGRLQRLSGGGLSTQLTVTTGTDGLAQCRFRPNPGTAPHQTVEAVLLDADDNPVGGPVHFNASLSLASQVAFDTGQCERLEQAGADTVQKAIDELCKLLGGGEPAIHVENLQVLVPDEGPAPRPELVRNDERVPLSWLEGGIQVICDENVAPAAFRTDPEIFVNPNCFLTVYEPLPGDSAPGFQPVTLAATVEVIEKQIHWVPTTMALSYVRQKFPPGPPALLARFTLKGNFIWQEGRDEVLLDGEAFGVPEAGRTRLRLPSGDGRRGGDFEMWFWLVEGDDDVQAEPLDLRILSLTWSPEVPLDTDPIIFVATITNRSQERLRDFDVLFRVDGDDDVMRVRQPPMAPGESRELTWQKQLAVGRHPLRVEIDPQRKLELVERAPLTSEITVVGERQVLDLRVRGLTWTPRVPGPFLGVWMSATVVNHSDVDTGTFELLWDLGDGVQESLQMSLTPDERGSPRVMHRYPEGTYQIRVILDPSQELSLKNREADGSVERTIEVRRSGPTLGDLENIGPVRMNRLRENGIETIAQLSAAKEEQVAQIVKTSPGRARALIEAARDALGAAVGEPPYPIAPGRPDSD